jgi:hypothetical protein
MKSYGMEMDGNFVIEKIAVKPIWTSEQLGRLIYVEADETYWLGGHTSWISIGSTVAYIKKGHIDFGYGLNQVNASSIPFEDSARNDVISAENVHDAIVSISNGDGLGDNAISSRSYGEESILNTHIKWGSTDDYVGAKDLPINSNFTGVVKVISTEEAINQIETNNPSIVRKLVSPSGWELAPAENLYRVTVVINPISNSLSVVQCYNQIGELVLPAKVTADLDNNRVYVWMPSPMSLTIVVIG